MARIKIYKRFRHDVPLAASQQLLAWLNVLQTFSHLCNRDLKMGFVTPFPGRRDGFRKTVASGQGFFDVFIVYSYRTKPPYARAKPSSR